MTMRIAKLMPIETLTLSKHNSGRLTAARANRTLTPLER